MSQNKLEGYYNRSDRSNKPRTMEVTIKLEDSDECENIIELEFIGLLMDGWQEMVEEEVTRRL